MLFTFFLKRLVMVFFCYVSLLVLIFSVAHLFVRLSAFGCLMLIPIIFWIMVPMILQYVLPIASGATVYVVFGNLVRRQEDVPLYFFRRAQWAAGAAVIIFSFCVSIVYGFLIFEFVPKSYERGKQALIALAQQQFLYYQPHIVYEPIPGLHLIFQEKEMTSSDTIQLKNIFLSFKNKHDNYLFTAQHGIVNNHIFFLNNGSLWHQRDKESYFASFDVTTFDIKNIMHSYEHQKNKTPSVKYASWYDFVGRNMHDKSLLFEMHKRLAHVLWQLLLPIIIFLGTFFIKKHKSVVLEAFFISGLLYLMMYIFMTLGYIIGGIPALVMLYAPPILLCCFCLYLFNYYYR